MGCPRRAAGRRPRSRRGLVMVQRRVKCMPGKRSNCAIAHVLDIVGDRWTILVIRDTAILGKRSFSEISASPEHIPPSTLTTRLALLVCQKLITKTPVAGGPGRQYSYELTQRGEDFLPVLVAMLQWSARHDPDSAVPRAMRQRLERDFIGVVESFRSLARLSHSEVVHRASGRIKLVLR